MSDEKQLSEKEVVSKEITNLTTEELLTADLKKYSDVYLKNPNKSENQMYGEYLKETYGANYKEYISDSFRNQLAKAKYDIDTYHKEVMNRKNNVVEEAYTEFKNRIDRFLEYITKYDIKYMSENKLKSTDIDVFHNILSHIYFEEIMNNAIIKLNLAFNLTNSQVKYFKKLLEVDIEKSPSEFSAFEYIMAEFQKFDLKSLKTNDNESKPYDFILMNANNICQFVYRHKYKTHGEEYEKVKKIMLEILNVTTIYHCVTKTTEEIKNILDLWKSEAANYEDFINAAEPTVTTDK